MTTMNSLIQRTWPKGTTSGFFRSHIKVNITKDSVAERKSVAHIQFEPEDVFALHQSLVENLKSRVAKNGALTLRVMQLESAMRQIRGAIVWAHANRESETLETIRRVVETALNTPSET